VATGTVYTYASLTSQPRERGTTTVMERCQGSPCLRSATNKILGAPQSEKFLSHTQAAVRTRHQDLCQSKGGVGANE